MTNIPDWPNIAPTTREYTGGDWPVKAVRMQNGVESRLLYGDRRTGQVVTLTYANIDDSVAEQFFQIYYSLKGTYENASFPLPITNHWGAGWGGNANFWNPGEAVKWRFDGPPKLIAVMPGKSTVQLKLIAVGAGG